jgi:hypothetical protein
MGGADRHDDALLGQMRRSHRQACLRHDALIVRVRCRTRRSPVPYPIAAAC